MAFKDAVKGAKKKCGGGKGKGKGKAKSKSKAKPAPKTTPKKGGEPKGFEKKGKPFDGAKQPMLKKGDGDMPEKPSEPREGQGMPFGDKAPKGKFAEAVKAAKKKGFKPGK